MKVHLAPAGIVAEELAIDHMAALAALDGRGLHSLTPSAADADAILFVQCHLANDDWSNRKIRASAAFREHRERCLVVDERDQVWCGLPGLYTSMPRSRFRPEHQRARGYSSVTEPADLLDPGSVAAIERDLLFSFVGSLTHPCRVPLFDLSHPRAVVERVRGFTFYDSSAPEYPARRARFAEVMLRSRFVLCPRGRGSSSIRFSEALAAGSVPVVIADDWVPPHGIDLAGCAITWPEGRTDGLIDHLLEVEPDAAAMGARGRAVFDAWFADDVVFDRLCEGAADLLAADPWAGFPRWGYPDVALARRVVRINAARARGVMRARLGR